MIAYNLNFKYISLKKLPLSLFHSCLSGLEWLNWRLALLVGSTGIGSVVGQQTRIRTQPHFAQPESAALRPPGFICAAQLLLSRSHLVQQAAFGAFSGSMPPGRAAALRCMPLTRYECCGRPHNPVHYFSSASLFVARQQPAFAAGCSCAASLHSHSAAYRSA